ncbi:cyclic nucleotide-binding domain-containing protein [Tanacetum coccineum]
MRMTMVLALMILHEERYNILLDHGKAMRIMRYMTDMITYADTDVVVVGVGSDGLSFAYELSKSDIEDHASSVYGIEPKFLIKMFPRKSEGEELEYPFFEGDDSSSDEWRDYGMGGDDYEGPLIFDDE